MEARRATLGDKHSDTLRSINNLGLLQAQGKLDEAELLLKEALEALLATLGDKHPDTLTSIGNLGVLLKALVYPRSDPQLQSDRHPLIVRHPVNC